MKFPAYHFLFWLLFYQQLSTCHSPIFYVNGEDYYSYGHGRAFFYYNQDDRVQVLSELKQAVRARYALLDIKRQRLGIDASMVFDRALQRERLIPDTRDSFAQARANLAFLDRIKATAAQLQDSHLQVKELVSLPDIYLGLKTRLVEGRLVVAAIESRLEEQWRHQQISIEVGDEVLAIDGQAVDDRLTQLQGFIAGSSQAYRRAVAAESLTRRSFYYPGKAESSLLIRSAEDQQERIVSLTWFTNAESIRPDAARYLLHHGINYRPEEEYVGASVYDPPIDLVDVEEWFAVDAADQLAYRTGYMWTPDQRLVAVIQLFSFYSLEVIQGEDERILAWELPIINFIKSLEQQKIQLILDIRWNEGGHTFLAENLVRILMPLGETYASYTEAFRITPSIRQMWQGQDYKLEPYHSDSQAVHYVNEAAMNGRDHTSVWSHSEPLQSHPEVGGYRQPIVVLLSPYCLSSCELLALLLQSNQRATLLGAASNGTGAGYFEWEPFSGGRWTDSYEIITADIPNYLIGRPGQTDIMLYSTPYAYLDFNQENRPVMVDQDYQEKVEDLLNAAKGWYSAAAEQLSREYLEQSH